MRYKRLACLGLFAFFLCQGKWTMASDSEFSATPDYSFDSYKSRDTYNLNRDMSSSLSRRNYSSSSRSFSGNVLINRNRSLSGNNAQRSGYSAPPSGYTAQPVGVNTYSSQRGYNSAYYRTNTYKY